MIGEQSASNTWHNFSRLGAIIYSLLRNKNSSLSDAFDFSIVKDKPFFPFDLSTERGPQNPKIILIDRQLKQNKADVITTILSKPNSLNPDQILETGRFSMGLYLTIANLPFNF